MAVRRRRWAGALAVSLCVWGLIALLIRSMFWLIPPDAPPPPGRVETLPPTEAPWFWIPDRIRSGETLAAVLHRNGLTAREVHELAEALSAHLSVRLLRPGDEVEIHFGRDGAVERVRVHRGLLESFEARREGPSWRGDRMVVHLERRDAVLHDSLRGSLFESMEAMGETAVLVGMFADVFQWDFDFYTQCRPGDRFSLLVEKLYRDGRFVGYGDLRAARYVSGDVDLAAFLYEDPTERRDYYDRKGKSMRKAFLRAPLKFRRVSSGFSTSRLHPVFNRRMPHLGVDYAAAPGTPVHSVASGVVTDISRGGGGGNVVTIRHAMGYVSKYLHLSRFERGLRLGKRVEQKEVVGYVGSTGTATGPHLDFRLHRYGKPVNPLKQIFPPGPPVEDEYKEDFRKRVLVLAARLGIDLEPDRGRGEVASQGSSR